MFARLLTVLAMLGVAGCISPKVKPDDMPPEPPITTVVPLVDEVVGPPQDLEEPVPDACEVLLGRLDETHPLLDKLDAALVGQSAQFAQALEEIRRPVPDLQVQECPDVGNSNLGNKELIGAIEWLYVEPPGLHYRARVDSGAETSSLSASEIVEFERDSEDWVRFTFQHSEEDAPTSMELPIKRAVLIRYPSSVEAERRVVVEFDIRLGEELQTTEFTLTDRSRMTYPIILGRAFLMDLYVVDVSRQFTHDRYEAP